MSPKTCLGKVVFACDLEEAAISAYRLAGGDSERRLYSDGELARWPVKSWQGPVSEDTSEASTAVETLCEETMMMLSGVGIDVYSNIAWNRRFLLKNPEESRANTCIDMGDDYFTRGKPHPMLEPGMRVPRYLAEASNKDVGILLFDVILGYGCHRDPAGVMAEAVKRL